jgi:hypothetical protein
MSHSTTTSRRWQILLGVTLTALLALGAAFLTTGASQAGPSTQQAAARPAGPPTDCPAIGLLVAAAVTATAPGAPTNVVTAALSRAATTAKATASDDARELAQNLADDLLAYRVTLTTPSVTSAQRHTDIGATLRSDLTALRHYCGL